MKHNYIEKINQGLSEDKSEFTGRLYTEDDHRPWNEMTVHYEALKHDLKELISEKRFIEAFECEKKIFMMKNEIETQVIHSALDTLQSEVQNTRSAHELQYEKFCNDWDLYLADYDAVAYAALERLKFKHMANIKVLKEHISKRYDQGNRIHPSKHFLELKSKEKSLARLGAYEEAQVIQEQLRALSLVEGAQQRIDFQKVMDSQVEKLMTQQSLELQSFLRRVEKERKKFILKRIADSTNLVRRNHIQINALAEQCKHHIQSKLGATQNLRTRRIQERPGYTKELHSYPVSDK